MAEWQLATFHSVFLDFAAYNNTLLPNSYLPCWVQDFHYFVPFMPNQASKVVIIRTQDWHWWVWTFFLAWQLFSEWQLLKIKLHLVCNFAVWSQFVYVHWLMNKCSSSSNIRFDRVWVNFQVESMHVMCDSNVGPDVLSHSEKWLRYRSPIHSYSRLSILSLCFGARTTPTSVTLSFKFSCFGSLYVIWLHFHLPIW